MIHVRILRGRIPIALFISIVATTRHVAFRGQDRSCYQVCMEIQYATAAQCLFDQYQQLIMVARRGGGECANKCAHLSHANARAYLLRHNEATAGEVISTQVHSTSSTRTDLPAISVDSVSDRIKLCRLSPSAHTVEQCDDTREVFASQTTSGCVCVCMCELAYIKLSAVRR